MEYFTVASMKDVMVRSKMQFNSMSSFVGNSLAYYDIDDSNYLFIYLFIVFHPYLTCFCFSINRLGKMLWPN